MFICNCTLEELLLLAGWVIRAETLQVVVKGSLHRIMSLFKTNNAVIVLVHSLNLENTLQEVAAICVIFFVLYGVEWVRLFCELFECLFCWNINKTPHKPVDRFQWNGQRVMMFIYNWLNCGAIFIQDGRHSKGSSKMTNSVGYTNNILKFDAVLYC